MNNLRQCKGGSRRAFTLVEILVALAIFMLLLAIILVPLNMGMTMLHLGAAKVDVQSATQRVIDRMRGDLTSAIYVYPNAELPTVTGTTASPLFPYGDAASALASISTAPYFDGDPCTSTTVRDKNLSRLDMLVPETNNGTLVTPVAPSYYIVTYYARRKDTSSSYQSIDNPIILYRAQIPFRGDPANPTYLINRTGSGVEPATTSEPYPPATSTTKALNADIYNSRYSNLSSCGSSPPAVVRNGSMWLTQTTVGEPNLIEKLTNEYSAASPAEPFILYGSHVSMLPVGVGMVTGLSYKESATGYVPPKSTFICADTNRDGVIDQVKLNVMLQKVDSMGAEPQGQELVLPQVVDLPNVRSLVNIH